MLTTGPLRGWVARDAEDGTPCLFVVTEHAEYRLMRPSSHYSAGHALDAAWEALMATDAARGDPPPATGAFRLPMRYVPKLLKVWDFTQAR